jgi:thioredoxin 1
MKEISIVELKEKLSNQENFVLDLYATWCGPCKIMLNNLKDIDSLSATNGTKYDVYKLNIDSDKDYVIGEMGIRSVPTIKFYNNGVETYSRSGVMSVSDIINVISNN